MTGRIRVGVVLAACTICVTALVPNSRFVTAVCEAHKGGRLASAWRLPTALGASQHRPVLLGLFEDGGRTCRTSAPKMVEELEVRGDNANNDVQQALLMTGVAVLAALGFCSGVFVLRGAGDATEWFAAYILEESLSVDNLFVFSLIFDYFQTPTSAQPRVLKWGLIAAVILRAVFIIGGLAVVERFKLALLPCALLLLYSAYGILFNEEEEEDLGDNTLIKWTKKYLPWTDEYDSDRFFTESKSEPGRLIATPLLLSLVCVELSDVLFAVDSVPAVFGVTTDPFIALTSNGFAILGLRQLYVLIAAAVSSFGYLRPAIAFILFFIGCKLMADLAGFEIETTISLLVVAGSLAVGIAASLLLPPRGDVGTSTSQTGVADAASEVGKSKK
mmetsp:Transcript_11336/g.18983  ORF Transcript_11336/g.18983 Transcript_11336/m.18983 type:complete len:389 (+) Transcript_11336:97-1263(+)|eukprot:CAMPEP_0119319242 /NCGR_PEP_ID=MMETSP1333-20130426/48875_1 /TAXON_ID=418940 /ORGANISM="Scyphosphaera apsteinii, Strain RCC1455" /LENGTH=388 /DNA_ID=CAMNT_0007325603 /DNA_START=91 /DNA_END=1257 /DNA_ORIENTATION=+